MEKKSKQVCLFFKSPNPSSPNGIDPYKEEFEKSGIYDVEFFTVLEFDFVNTKVLLDILKDSNSQFEGIILTSQNAVKSLEIVFSTLDSSSILDKWRRKFYFCVGKETGKSIEEKLQIDSSKIIGKECGNALELAKNIISFFQISCEKKQDQEINLLFLCGNLRRNDLIEVLEKENQILNFTKFKITELVSYQTKISSNLNSNSEQSNQSPLLTIINQSNPTWFIFFSPSGVEAIASQLTTEEKLKILSTIKFAAIGATTGKAIKSHFGINQIAIASKPSPPALFEAITNSLS